MSDDLGSALVEAAAEAMERKSHAMSRGLIVESDIRLMFGAALAVLAGGIEAHTMPTYTGLASEGYDWGVADAAALVRSVTEQVTP